MKGDGHGLGQNNADTIVIKIEAWSDFQLCLWKSEISSAQRFKIDNLVLLILVQTRKR